ncbi:hypothetical protein JTB14_024073 [Gonioctena quinquepunctata]|nr:hypothetical protein JTB14_024073 [Gonioctena quinquepunctata]
MKSELIYRHGYFNNGSYCRLLNPRIAAITAAIYTLNISILVVLIYSWRISINIPKFTTLQDVYYGVQIAYLAIIGSHLFMIILSIGLLLGIYREILTGRKLQYSTIDKKIPEQQRYSHHPLAVQTLQK